MERIHVCGDRAFPDHSSTPTGGERREDRTDIRVRSNDDNDRIGQLLANRGRYGDLEFFSPDTFEKLLPVSLDRYCPGTKSVYGLGIYWKPGMKPGAPQESKRREDMILSPRTLGHGSLSQCIFRVDLEKNLVITQIRKEGGKQIGEWVPKFLQTVADCVVDE
jgi:hypothetical protein